jgi:signal transduction histidine kinase
MVKSFIGWGRVRVGLQQMEAGRQMAAVGQFASQISHEIRNPLTSMNLNLQGLQRDVENGRIPPESARPVELCLKEIHRLDGVVSGVLNLARPSSIGCQALFPPRRNRRCGGGSPGAARQGQLLMSDIRRAVPFIQRR